MSFSRWPGRRIYWITGIRIFSSSAQPLSRVWLFETPQTIAHQAPLSMGFPRQNYWSRLPFPLQWIFPTQGSNSWPLEPPGKPSAPINAAVFVSKALFWVTPSPPVYTGSWSGGWSLNITALEKSLLCQHPSRAIEDTVEDRNFTTQFQRCSEENPERTCRNCPSCPAKGPALPALKMVRLCHFCLAGWWFLSPGDFFFNLFLASLGLRCFLSLQWGGSSCWSTRAPEHRLTSCGTQLSGSTTCGIFQDQRLNPRPLHWQVDA